MKQHDIRPAKGAVQKRKRVARGNASGWGGEAGRGHKGAKARTGYSCKPGFEGGQMPLYRRLPKKKGFNNPHRVTFQAVNLFELEKAYQANDEVNNENLRQKGLVVGQGPVKLLATGELSKKLVVKVQQASKSAIEKLKQSGSVFELVK